MRWVTAHRTPGFTRIATAVMDAGGDLRVVAAAVAVLAVVAVLTRAYRVALAGAAALVLGVLTAGALKQLIDRPRPPGPVSLVDLGGSAMPSTHAAWISAASAAVLVALARTASGRRPGLWWWLACGALVVANVLVGVLMVYLGGHWPTDVLVGWALGVAIGTAVATLATTRRSPAPPQPTPAPARTRTPR